MRRSLSLATILGFAVIFVFQTASVPTSSEAADKRATYDLKQARQTTSHIEEEDAERISLKDAKEAYDKGEAVFVDTRSAVSYENEHIKGAVNIPAREIAERYNELPQDKQLIFYCS